MKHLIKTTVTILFFISAFSMTACNKEISLNPTHEDNLAGTYKITGLTIETTTGTRDLFTTLDDCQKQSTQTLQANYSYQLINNCDAAENESGTWSVKSKRITINGISGDIVSFNGQNLVIAFDEFMGMPGRMIETLTRQK